MKKNGFTLIEMLITVAIIGILAAVAYPAYNQFVYKGARAEAMSALLDIANKQEQYYANNHEYTNSLQRLRVAATTETGLYSIRIVSDGSSFTVTAAANDAPATKDLQCTSFSINDLGQKQVTGTADAAACWGK